MILMIKELCCSILISLFLPVTLWAQGLKPVTNEAFIRGERLKYKVYYDSQLTGKIIAGFATAEVKFENKQINGRNTYHLIGSGKTKGAFNLIFKVDDRFESYVDEEYLIPWTFIRHTHEGDYRYDDEVIFNQFTGSYSSTRKTRSIPPGTQDLLSTIYAARTYDLSNSLPGETFPITFLLDDSVYVSMIRFIRHEEVILDLGTFNCLRFQPMVVTGNVFSQPYPMDVWITNDQNHIPVLIKSGVIIGSVKLELIEYKGLASPLTSLIPPQQKGKRNKK